MAVVDPVKSKAPLNKLAKRLDGMTFGRLAVTGWAGRDRKGDPLWTCVCECGETTVVLSRSLLSGASKSCGCLSRDVARDCSTTHGLSRTAIYRVWVQMICRCHEPNTEGFENYGGRGIAVCDEWRQSIEVFVRDMGPRPKGATIERKDNNAGYSAGNCRWATRGEQALNKRTSRPLLVYQGESLSLVEWARRFHLPYHTVYNRVRSGWTLDRVFGTP